MIKRFSPPTHLDVAPQYEQYHVELEDGNVQIWIQMNEMIEPDTKPHWRRLGDILERIWLKYDSSIPNGSYGSGNPHFTIDDIKNEL